MSELKEWEGFYVIVGSSAGALIGLQFVVMTLIAAKPPKRAAEGSAAFATPTVVHFGTVLLLSALLCAPWSETTIPAALWGLTGLCGVVYAFVVVRRMRTQGAYRPRTADWVSYAALPLTAYVLLALSAFLAAEHARAALFAVGGAALLLLLVGIHNAWDSISYHVLSSARDDDAP